MSPCEFRTKEAQNARKSPKTAHLCSALPSIVICVAAQCRHAYSCNKIRQSPNSIISLQIAVFCVLWLGGVLDRSPSQIATQGFLGAYTGIFTAEKKKDLMVFVRSRSYAKLRLPPRNSPDQCLYSRRSFCFYHPDFITQTDFTDPPKLEGGVCHKPLCCRRCRRT